VGEVPVRKTKEVTSRVIPSVGDRGRTPAFRLACSSGTYAAGLAHDLGAALAVVGISPAAPHPNRRIHRQTRGRPPLPIKIIQERVQEEEPVGTDWIPFETDRSLRRGYRLTPSRSTGIQSRPQTVWARATAAREGEWVKLI